MNDLEFNDIKNSVEYHILKGLEPIEEIRDTEALTLRISARILQDILIIDNRYKKHD